MIALGHNWTIETEAELRDIIKPPPAPIKLGIRDRIGPGAQTFFAASSCFVCVTTRQADGLPDVSPLGGTPGLVRAVDERTIFIALDGPLQRSRGIRQNLATNAFCGLLVMVPGNDNTIRINGTARVVEDTALLEATFGAHRRPEAAIRLVQALWLHCPKAFVRSALWAVGDGPDPCGPTAVAGNEALHLTTLDDRCRRFIARSPFLVLGSSLADGGADASPRGDPPGFVQVLDNDTLLLPDRPGNRLADNFRNILCNPFAALLFLLPGSEDVLRVRGQARLIKEPSLLEPLSVNGKQPQVGLLLEVRSAVLERSGAVVRSRLWDPAVRITRETLPSIGELTVDQLQPNGRFKGVKAKIADQVLGRMLDRDAKKNLY